MTGAGWGTIAVLMVGSFVLGVGTTAVGTERLRSRVRRMRDELDDLLWAFEVLHQPGQLCSDPPENRWARPVEVGAAGPVAEPMPDPEPDPEPAPVPVPVEEPVLVPARAGRFGRVRAHWDTDLQATLPPAEPGPVVPVLVDDGPVVWTDAPLVGGPGWLPVAAGWCARPARWFGRLAVEGLFEAGMWMLAVSWAGCRAVARPVAGVLARPSARLAWRWAVRQYAYLTYPPHVDLYGGMFVPVSRGRAAAHRQRRGKKPYLRFVADVRDREWSDAAWQAGLDVWVEFGKEVPAVAMSEDEQEWAFRESLAELLARAELEAARR